MANTKFTSLKNINNVDVSLYNYDTAPIAQLVECPLRGTGSIPGRDIPKSLKMVLAAPRLALKFTG